MRPTPHRPRAAHRPAAWLALVAALLLAGPASAATIFLCRGAAQGATPAMFWSTQPCAVHQAQTLQAALVPDNLSFEQQVRWFEQGGASAGPGPAPLPAPAPAPAPPPAAATPPPPAASAESTPLFTGLSPECRALADQNAVLTLRERQAVTPLARELLRPQRVSIMSEMLRLGCRP